MNFYFYIKMNVSVLTFIIDLSNAICEEVKQNLYTRTINTRLPNILHTEQDVSKVACSSLCDRTDNCKSVYYNMVTSECELSREPLIAASQLGETNDTNWVNYAKDEWMLAFRATPGAGGDLYYIWKEGVSVTTDDVTCMSTNVTSCNKHYRSAIVDKWMFANISTVKFALYESNDVVSYVLFNGTGSDNIDWFSQENILESPYAALKYHTLNFFSLFGNDPGRRFMINKSYNGCPDDRAYIIVIVNNDVYKCNYDNQQSFPQFFYSTSSSYGFPDDMTGMALADVLAIYIK